MSHAPEHFEPATVFTVVEDADSGWFGVLIGHYRDATGNVVGVEVSGLPRRLRPDRVRMPLMPRSIGVALAPPAPPRQLPRED